MDTCFQNTGLTLQHPTLSWGICGNILGCGSFHPRTTYNWMAAERFLPSSRVACAVHRHIQEAIIATSTGEQSSRLGLELLLGYVGAKGSQDVSRPGAGLTPEMVGSVYTRAAVRSSEGEKLSAVRRSSSSASPSSPPTEVCAGRRGKSSQHI